LQCHEESALADDMFAVEGFLPALC